MLGGGPSSPEGPPRPKPSRQALEHHEDVMVALVQHVKSFSVGWAGVWIRGDVGRIGAHRQSRHFLLIVNVRDLRRKGRVAGGIKDEFWVGLREDRRLTGRA